LKPLDNEADVADLEQELIGLKTSPSSTTDHFSPESAQDKSVLHSPHASLSLSFCRKPRADFARQKWVPLSHEVSGPTPRCRVVTFLHRASSFLSLRLLLCVFCQPPRVETPVRLLHCVLSCVITLSSAGK
jgi:hypothetical protein